VYEAFPIRDVLFHSDKSAHLIPSPKAGKEETNPNALTVSQLRDAFIDSLRTGDRTAGHIEGTRLHLDHFIRILGDVPIMSLTDDDTAAFREAHQKEKAARRSKVKRLRKEAANRKTPKKPLCSCLVMRDAPVASQQSQRAQRTYRLPIGLGS
jgi:hypothetical protein